MWRRSARGGNSLIHTTMAAVKDRLTKEIAYWDHRAEDLKAQEQAGRQPRMNWLMARQRADDVTGPAGTAARRTGTGTPDLRSPARGGWGCPGSAGRTFDTPRWREPDGA